MKPSRSSRVVFGPPPGAPGPAHRDCPGPPAQRGGHALFAFLLLLYSIASPLAQAQPARDTLTPLLRAVDQSDAALAAAASAMQPGPNDPALPNPSELFRRASASPANLPTGLALADAAEAWHQRMTHNGAARFVMVGEDSSSIRAAARSVIALTAAATAVLDRAIDAADRASDEGREGPGDEQVTAALHARQIVLPLRAARAALVLAASANDPKNQTMIAALALETSLRVEAVSAWSESERLLVSGWALVLNGKAPEGLAALGKARAAANAKDADGDVRSEVLIDAALGEALALLASRGPVTARESMQRNMAAAPFVSENRVDLWAFLVGAEVLMRIAPLEAAMFQDASARAAAMSWPWRTVESVLPLLDFAARGVVYNHLGARLSATTAFDALPDSARVAFAWSALSKADPDFDAAQRAVAPLADPEQSPSDVVYRDASRLFCRAGAPSDDPIVLARVSRVGLAFADCCAQDDGIGEVLAAAAHAAEKRLRFAKSSDGLDAAQRDLVAALRALSSAPIRMEDAERDPWRLALGRVMLGLVSRGSREESEAYANESLSTLRLVTSGDAVLESEIILAETWTALLRVVEDSDDEEAPVGRIAAQLTDLCTPAKSRSPAATEHIERAKVMAVGRARALLATRHPAEALAELEPFIGADASPTSRALDAGIEALVLLEREAEARSLAARSTGAASTLARLSRRAWTSMEKSTAGFIADAAPPSPPSPPPPTTVFGLAADHSGDAAQSTMHRTRLAWSLLLGGHATEAAEAFRAALQEDPSSAGLRRGLAESLLVVQDEESAFRLFSEIAKALEARQEFSRDYWHAWTRMLEILSRRPRTPDEDARIRREIARLRSLDSALEQPDCMVRIKELESRLK